MLKNVVWGLKAHDEEGGCEQSLLHNILGSLMAGAKVR